MYLYILNTVIKIVIRWQSGGGVWSLGAEVDKEVAKKLKKS